MKKSKTGSSAISPILILFCLIGFVINFITYYPGFFNIDVLNQFNEAVTGHYSNWHPPAMAYAWHFLNFIYKGPQIMLALQLFLLWSSCYLFAVSFKSKVLRVFIVLLFFLAPFIQNGSGYIVKDSQMALSWLLAIAILFNQIKTANRHIALDAILSAMLLLYGTWMRHDAPAGLLPLCFVWGWIIFYSKKRFIKITVSLLLFISIIAGEKIVTAIIIKPEIRYPESVLYMHDLTAFFMRTHQNVYPAIMYNNPDFDTNYIKQHYNAASIDKLIWPSDKNTIEAKDATTANAMKTAWFNCILHSPKTYLDIRYNTFLYFLRIKHGNKMEYYFPWVIPSNYGYAINTNKRFYKMYTKYMDAQKGMIYFIPWFWMLLNLLLFVFIFFLKDPLIRIVYGGLLTSSLLYILPQFFLSTIDSWLRYIYWPCLACTIALLMLIQHLFFRNS